MDNRLIKKSYKFKEYYDSSKLKKLPQPSGYIKSLTPSKYFVIVDVQTIFQRQFNLPTYQECE